ncbi:hypothetical protein CK203_067871 [Vitis vinifera]|uniref:Uncharacterized protein n=1 Tax=Vitis vinifera TaxID=29760 RepID=A0A438BZA4_VITVI|nr:hypothetical protein CK203_067871 [Vitis vinifera]
MENQREGRRNSWGFIIFTCRVFLGKFAVHLGAMKFKYHRVSRCLRSRHVLSISGIDGVETRKSINFHSTRDNRSVLCLSAFLIYQKEWPNEEEKEQFSPVSVLDCPFEDEDEDEDEEMCSPFQHRVTHMEGNKQKLLQKIRRFESVAELEPVDLEKRIALLELDDEPLHQSPAQPSMSIHRNKEEMTTERQAQNLLKLIKAEVPSDSSKFNADTLLLDFFKERIMERHENPNADEFNQELLRVTEDWMSGHHRDLLLGWEVQNHRKAISRTWRREANGENWRKKKKRWLLKCRVRF